ncbi:MAG: hypothetical protein EOO27_06635 [Comamonadaceae bacterium]|nr:MAG: hypothetical protein EOO27_06635 [Comamonadaceae bacterium]
MALPRSHNPAARWIWCRRCKLRSYLARSDAKSVRRRHHGSKGLSVFPCPHNPGQYHVGHRPTALTHGAIDRRRLRNQALKDPGPVTDRDPPPTR